MSGNIGTRLRRLEASAQPGGFAPVGRIIADPEQDAWAATDRGIDAEIERRRVAKANPSTISMASGGNGSTQHVAGELFKMMTGVFMQHVPYRGGVAALADLISGRVFVVVD